MYSALRTVTIIPGTVYTLNGGKAEFLFIQATEKGFAFFNIVTQKRGKLIYPFKNGGPNQFVVKAPFDLKLIREATEADLLKSADIPVMDNKKFKKLMDTTLTQEQAKEMIDEGHKVRHESYPEGNFVAKKAGTLVSAEGRNLDSKIFWMHHTDKQFLTGWSIVKD